MTSITSVELNFLVFRYLHESGFIHSAFTFGYEAGINKCSIDGNGVPPGALITFVQRGIQYLEMEANLGNEETGVEEDFLFLQPLDIITKNVHELRQIVKEKKKCLQKEKEREKDIEKVKEDRQKDRAKDKEKSREKEKERERDKDKEKERERETERERERSRVREKTRQEREKGTEKSRERKEKDKERSKQLEDHSKETLKDQEAKVSSKLEKNDTSGGSVSMDISPISNSQPSEFSSSEVTILEGHTKEVCTCAWNPVGSVLASGSGDSTARIWTVADGPSWLGSQNGPLNVAVLNHVQLGTNDKDITTLDWNVDGTLLATGAYDGHPRIWNTHGELKSTLSKHQGAVFALKWNKKGDYLLSGSLDRTAIVWDVKAEVIKQQFDFHAGAILDVDWRNNASFATCSDNMIHVCKIGENRPVKSFSGHQLEVNCVKWDPTGSVLASCSDDKTVKIWSMKQDKYIHDLREHVKAIYTIRWSPTGPSTVNPNQRLLLASASFDNSVKLWDAEVGKSLCSLNDHKDAVHSVSFSPNGEQGHRINRPKPICLVFKRPQADKNIQRRRGHL